MTLLHCSLLGGDVRLIERLLELGCDVHARNAYGDTCLYLAVYTAAYHGFRSLVRQQPSKILDVTDRDVDVETITLMEASHYNVENVDLSRVNFYILDLLLEHGADVNAANLDGHAPLHYAASMVRVPLKLKTIEDYTVRWEQRRSRREDEF